MKLEEFKEKAVSVYKKIGKKTVIIASAVLVVGIAVMLNFILWGAADEAKTPAIDLADLSDEAAGETDALAETNEYFAKMALERTQARDESLEVLNGVVSSESAVDEMKEEALAEINQIAKDVENESNIETLVMSKGFAECVAVVSGDAASVIVRSDGLTDAEIAQISEIVYEQSGIIPANLKIIEN